MNDYKKYIISKGGEELGLLFGDIKDNLLTPSQYEMFKKFMQGQTSGIIEGIPVCYTCDYVNFIKGYQNND